MVHSKIEGTIDLDVPIVLDAGWGKNLGDAH
jgi:hypothetical protein